MVAVYYTPCNIKQDYVSIVECMDVASLGWRGDQKLYNCCCQIWRDFSGVESLRFQRDRNGEHVEVSNPKWQSATRSEVALRVAQSADLGGAGWSWSRVGE